MRLLYVTDDGEINVTKDLLIRDVPPYAILSHTWGDEDDEATYKDLISGSGKAKAGYRKIWFCAEQAARDDLQYFWVDTCSIDKSNLTELTEAINAMFRWYRGAAKCYVYLTDVLMNDRQPTGDPFQWTCEPAFRNSRWFRRGWTVQELIAPASVEFFSAEGQRLGDKKSLEQQIHEVTSIAIQVLRGADLSKFGTAERFSWAQNRETQREEDQAYCLLGIFDVYMPLIYGEGTKSATTRLREEINKRSTSIRDNDPLNLLPYAAEAPFNSPKQRYEFECLDNTRVDILHKIQTWVDARDGKLIFWLNGLAGTGKSTIARTIARRTSEKNRLAATFFFVSGGGDVGHAGKFVTSIAVQLANNIPSLRRHICDAITEQNEIANLSLRDQWQQLIIRPLSKINEWSDFSYILIIDALDECDSDNDMRIILQLLAEIEAFESIPLRILLTSRPEMPIRQWFKEISYTRRLELVLHHEPPSTVDHDIYLFLKKNLGFIGKQCFLGADWPGEEVIDCLVVNARGLFIWAATACRFIHEGRKKQIVKQRLSNLVDRASPLTAPEKRLNQIYNTVLQHSIPPQLSLEEKEVVQTKLRDVLGSLVTLFSPLPASSIGKLVQISEEEINETLEDLHAILDIPEDHNETIWFHHPSFREFLLDKEKCVDSNLLINEQQAHETLAFNCILVMSASLKRDICETGAPGSLTVDIDHSHIQKSLSPELQYACLYWIHHLQKGPTQLLDDELVHRFLQEHFLHWLEALGWMQKLSEGIYAINSLQIIIHDRFSPQLSEFIHDVKRFALYNRPGIERAPLQTYCSALIFAPLTSVIRRRFQDEIPQWLYKLPRVHQNWNALLQTLEGHTGRVRAVAFSPDGKLLASAANDFNIKLWDTQSGAPLQTLKGHKNEVVAISFSLDGTLASASADTTVKLWDTRLGVVLQTFQLHNPVDAVIFSPHGKLLASWFEDTTIKLRDLRSDMIAPRSTSNPSRMRALSFSADGKLLAWSTQNKRIRLWDTGSESAVRTFTGHESVISSIAFSPNNKILAAATHNVTVYLWDVESGQLLQTLISHSDGLHALAFSRNGMWLASASNDDAVQLWNVSAQPILQRLTGHTQSASAAAFSPDTELLATGSSGRTVRLWDARLARDGPEMFEDHSDCVTALAFSADGRLLLSASKDGLSMVWDVRFPKVIRKFNYHSGIVYAIAFSPDGRRLASASSDRRIRIWSIDSPEPQQVIRIEKYVQRLSFFDDGTINIEEVTTNAMPEPLDASSYADAIDSVSVKDQWITRGTEKILWIPPDYRPSSSAIFGSTVALGHWSGRVTILEFKF